MSFRQTPQQEPGSVELWWRAEDKRYANYDPWAEYEQPSGSHLVIELNSYKVARHTPKGVWISFIFGGEQFIRGDARKQFALPTKELALQDLVVRKKYHVSGCEARLQQAKEHLREAGYALLREQEGVAQPYSVRTFNDLPRCTPI